MGDGGELLILQGDVAGDAHARLPTGDELELRGHGAQRIGRGSAGFERTVVELGLDQDEVVAARLRHEGAGEQLLPRERLRRAGEDRCEGVVKGGEGGVEAGQVRLAVLEAEADKRECGEQAAGAWIGDQLAQERLGVDGAVHELFEVLRGKEHQPLLVEIGRRVRAADGAEMGLVGRGGGGQGGGGGVRLLGDLGVDHHHQEVLVLREITVHRHRALVPGEGAGEQRVRVCGHAEPAGGQRHGNGAEQHPGDDDEGGVAGATRDDAGEDGLEGHGRNTPGRPPTGSGRYRDGAG